MDCTNTTKKHYSSSADCAEYYMKETAGEIDEAERLLLYQPQELTDHFKLCLMALLQLAPGGKPRCKRAPWLLVPRAATMQFGCKDILR
jgi:hypothetical protein